MAVSIKKRIFAADKKWIYVLKYMEEVFKNLPLAEQKKMLDYLAKLPDVRYLSSEERKNTMRVLRPSMITTPVFMVLILKV